MVKAKLPVTDKLFNVVVPATDKSEPRTATPNALKVPLTSSVYDGVEVAIPNLPVVLSQNKLLVPLKRPLAPEKTKFPEARSETVSCEIVVVAKVDVPDITKSPVADILPITLNNVEVTLLRSTFPLESVCTICWEAGEVELAATPSRYLALNA